ncbi:MAG: UDP-N-acetylmuramate dehydrogenase [Ignavibacteriae bacterium]|nr:UDP-N-acetylmuramate dehydrogenase [Ignavibacteriota bacterium]
MTQLPELRGIISNVALANHTTIKLGGTAKYFLECRSTAELLSALEYARKNRVRTHILGGGSNTIFCDKGFDGLVIKIGLRGVQFIRDGERVKMVVAAGENWDDFVSLCVTNGLTGVECLSGIPGLVGATPIQNVGAYGQEVSGTIESVKAIQRDALHERTFFRDDCMFGYRQSRFNTGDQDAFVITEVTFRLRSSIDPEIKYPELRRFIDATVAWQSLRSASERIAIVRNAVIALRNSKSMVIDEADPNARSVGSFFKNPVLSKDEFANVQKRCGAAGISVPSFPAGEKVKIPAAWLVENAGFTKGFRSGGVGVSTKHSLALVNHNGTAAELLALAETISMKVKEKFGVTLEREPVVVSP